MSDPRTFVVSGATGLVGSALTRELESDGVRVVRLVRRPVKDPQREARWSPAEGEIDAAALEGADAVVHLAGENIVRQRWSPAFKERIRKSRIDSTRLLAETLARLERKPRVFVSASAIGYYGDRGRQMLDEDSPPGVGFLAETCQAWEAAGQAAWEAGLRVAQVRIGVVLSPEGGALAKMIPAFRWGMGGVLAGGGQSVSWISLPDLTRVLRFVADHEPIHGAVNGTAPHPVTNRELTKTLGAKLERPTLLPVPAWALRLSMGEMADPLLIESADVRPKKLLEAGFHFETPHLAGALDRLLD